MFCLCDSEIKIRVGIILMLSNSLFVLSQSIGDHYRGVPNYGSRGLPYGDDYYERYSSNDRYPWNEQPRANFPKTGIDSIYSDKRCIIEGNKDSYLGPVTVKTRLGSVEGTYVYLCDGPGVTEYDRPKKIDLNIRPKIYRNLTIFLGIPYAKPPTRENGLRFKAPQFLPAFTVIRALEYKDACPQSPVYYGETKGVYGTKEDCLYLNIFTPTTIKRFQREKFPVMIYIHGGDWDHGSANTFPGHMLAASQEVVVVTFNYRLGPLGFLATADNSSAGNYGLLDQAMAIEWVYDNIEEFNGDPKLITLFGPGSGAASAGIHMLNHRLNGKIKRVIAQSGAAVAEWATIPDATWIYNNSFEFAKLLDCYYEPSTKYSTWKTIECLKEISISSIQVAELQPKVGWLPWGPVIDAYTRDYDRQMLTASTKQLLKSDFLEFGNVDGYLTGVTKDEAFDDPHLKFVNYRVSKEFFMDRIKRFPPAYNYTLDPEALIKAISFYYIPCDKNAENITLMRQNYIDMLSDYLYNAPNDKMVKSLINRGIKTYMYVLNYTAEGIRNYKKLDISNMFVPHDSEYYFITGAPFMDPNLYPSELKLQYVNWTEGDRNMSEFFMTSWANFAKFGNPTPSPLFETIHWDKTDLREMSYLSINTTNLTTVMRSGYRQKDSAFWNSYVFDLMQWVSPTWPPMYQPWEIRRHTYEAALWGVLAATVLFILLAFMFCCLYCKVKNNHVVSTDDIPDAVSTTPSSIDTLLNMRKMESRSRYLAQRMETSERQTQV